MNHGTKCCDSKWDYIKSTIVWEIKVIISLGMFSKTCKLIVDVERVCSQMFAVNMDYSKLKKDRPDF